MESQEKSVTLIMEELQLKEKSHDLFNIGVEEFLVLVKNGTSLDHLFILHLYDKNIDIRKDISSSKIEAWRVTLIRKGYLDPKDNSVTELGKSLLIGGSINEGIIKSKAEIKKVVDKIKSDFDKWWEVFPATDAIKEINVVPTRGLRTQKEKCREIFKKMINNQEYTAEAIIKATQFDVQNRKNLSLRCKENKLTFLHNSAKYLNDRDFEPFIGQDITNKQPKKSGGVVDI